MKEIILSSIPGTSTKFDYIPSHKRSIRKFQRLNIHSLTKYLLSNTHTHTHTHTHRSYILTGKTNNKQIYNKISSSGKSFEENKLE